jgi:para-nitrobenzyl esterase
VWTWAKTQAQAGRSDVYLYYFTRGAPPDAPASGRAYHGAELYYVFRNLNLFDWQWEVRDRDLENIISSYWVNFAIHGNPNGHDLPKWAPYTASQSDRVMLLGDKVQMGPTRLDKEKITLFDAYYAALLLR